MYAGLSDSGNCNARISKQLPVPAVCSAMLQAKSPILSTTFQLTAAILPSSVHKKTSKSSVKPLLAWQFGLCQSRRALIVFAGCCK